MKIRIDSLLYKDNSNYDYVDNYDYVFADPVNKTGILDVAETFCQPGPKWVEGLLSLRDRIVGVFGLKTAAMQAKEENPSDKWAIGAKAGIFGVFGKAENEMILGGDDKHLDFRVSRCSYRPTETTSTRRR